MTSGVLHGLFDEGFERGDAIVLDLAGHHEAVPRAEIDPLLVRGGHLVGVQFAEGWRIGQIGAAFLAGDGDDVEVAGVGIRQDVGGTEAGG